MAVSRLLAKQAEYQERQMVAACLQLLWQKEGQVKASLEE